MDGHTPVAGKGESVAQAVMPSTIDGGKANQLPAPIMATIPHVHDTRTKRRREGSGMRLSSMDGKSMSPVRVTPTRERSRVGRSTASDMTGRTHATSLESEGDSCRHDVKVPTDAASQLPRRRIQQQN